MNNVSNIEKKIPEIKTIPIVNLDSNPAPEPITSGITPTIVEIPVITIGLNLFLHAKISDSKDFFPRDFNCLANSTIKIPFLAAIPIKIINPIWLNIFNEFSNIRIADNGANKVNGTESIIISGNLKLSNCAHKTK